MPRGAQEFRRTEEVVIASGASQSGAIDLTEKGSIMIGIQMPAAWTAAKLTFLGSFDGTTYGDLYDESGEYQIYSAVAGAFISTSFLSFLGLRYLKLRSGVTATPVNQGAERTFNIVIAAGY